MSEQLHPTRLEWDGRKGLARHDGVQIQLHHAPGGGHLAEVHYTPGLQAEVRDRCCDARRDMTPDEIHAAQRWLANMALLAREAVGQVL